VTRGCFLTLIANPVQWNNWIPYDTPNQALSSSSGTPDRTWLTLKGFDPSGISGQIIAFWSDVWVRLINNSKGTNLLAGGNNESGANSGIYEIRQEVNLIFKDLSGDAVNAKYWMKDFNNGNRVGTQINDNPTTVPTRIYTGTAVSGESSITADGGVLTGVIWRDIGNGTRFQNVVYDYRCQANNSNDVFTFFSIKYGYTIDQANISLKGTVPSLLDRTMFIDTTIIEKNKSVVDAYTAIENANKFNDAAFAFLEDNITDYQERIVSRSGRLIDAGSNNIVIDANASTAFNYDGSTITISASNFIGDLLTTGLITFSNGATISGIYTDTNGTVAPSAQLTVSVNQTGCDIVILAAGTDNVLASVDQLAGNTFVYTFSGALRPLKIGLLSPILEISSR
jgi:hypothetical protein